MLRLMEFKFNLILLQYRLHYKVARFDIRTEDEIKPPKYSRATAVELWAHPEKAEFRGTPTASGSALTSPRRRVPASSSSSNATVNPPTNALPQDSPRRGRTNARNAGSSSANVAPNADSSREVAMAREICDLKKRADLQQARAEKMKLENAGLREVQKTLEKERKSDQKKLETLQRRIGSAEEVEKATAQIPMTLKKMEDVLSTQRGSIAQATKHHTAEMAKCNNSVTDVMKTLTDSVGSLTGLVSKVVGRLDKLEGVLVGSVDNSGNHEGRESDFGRDGNSSKKRGGVPKHIHKRNALRHELGSSSSSDVSTPKKKDGHTKQGDQGKASSDKMSGKVRVKTKSRSKKRVVFSDSGSTCSDESLNEESDESDKPTRKGDSWSRSSKKRRSGK